jgi:hypothetical protein
MKALDEDSNSGNSTSELLRTSEARTKLSSIFVNDCKVTNKLCQSCGAKGPSLECQ